MDVYRETDLLDAAADRFEHDLRFVSAPSDRSLSVRAIQRFRDQRARQFQGAGLGTGDPVGILVSEPLEFIKTFFALRRLEALPVLLSPRSPVEELNRRAGTADLSAVVCSPDRAGHVDKMQLPDLRLVLGTSDTEHCRALAGFTGTLPPLSKINNDDEQPAFQIFTSGTTGPPEPVSLSRHNIQASVRAVRDHLPLEPDDTWYSPLPLYHMGGIAPVFRGLVTGTDVVCGGVEVDSFARYIRDFRVTGMSLVPKLFREFLETESVREVVDPPLECILVGGGKLRSQTIETAMERDIPLYPTYGLTETASAIAIASPGELQDRPETVGQPLDSVEVQFVGEKGEGDEEGEENRGEIIVAGPMLGKTPRTDRLVEREGKGPFYRTGDRGYRDEQNYLFVEHRKSDRITSGGVTVNTDEVRDVIEQHAMVKEAAVVGREDEEFGQRLEALVLARKPGAVTAEELETYCKDRLSDARVPKKIKVMSGDLPRTPSGTLDRDRLFMMLDRDGPK